MPGNLTITVLEAAERLGLSRNSAYAAVHRGEIPTVRFGKLLRVPLPAFEQLLKGERPSNTTAKASRRGR